MLIILVNIVVFGLELMGGEAFVTRWALVPAHITAGHDLITILTSMFMHGGWSHIIGNMIFLWAFGPEIEDSMGRGRYLAFYLIGGLAATFSQVEKSLMRNPSVAPLAMMKLTCSRVRSRVRIS